MATPPDEPPPAPPPPDQARTRVLEQQHPPGPPRGPRRRLPGGPWPWLAALLLVVIAGVALAYFLTRGDDDNKSEAEVSVPALVGFARAQAVSQAQRLGLRTAVKEVLADQAVGTVVAQDPQAGEQVPKGSLLVLNVSKGAAPVEVPNLVGLNEAQAGVRLSEVGLESKIARVTSTVESGQVVGQDPEAGTQVKKGSTVTVNVSKGGATTTTTTTTTTLTHLTTTVAPPPPPPPPAPARGTVPNVVGENLAEAVNDLANAGYVPQPVAVQSDKTPGTVVSQKPAAGARATAGSSVEIRFAALPS